MSYTHTTYDVVCSNCHSIAFHGDIGEYPYSWQFAECPKCSGVALPDLEHPFTHVVGKDSGPAKENK